LKRPLDQTEELENPTEGREKLGGKIAFNENSMSPSATGRGKKEEELPTKEAASAT